MSAKYYLKLPNGTQHRLWTYLIAIDWIIVFEGIDAGHGEGHRKANDRNAEAVPNGLLENLHVGCHGSVKSEKEMERVWTSPTSNKPSTAFTCPQEKPIFLSKAPVYPFPTPTPAQSLSFPRIYAPAIPSFRLFVCLFLQGIICALPLEASNLLFLLPEPFPSSPSLLPESLLSPPWSGLGEILCASLALDASLPYPPCPATLCPDTEQGLGLHCSMTKTKHSSWGISGSQ